MSAAAARASVGALVGLEGASGLAEPCDRLLVCHAESVPGREAFYDQAVATARRPTARDTVRALWLLGLREPIDVEEIRSAWKQRVAQAHPDRRLDNNEAATRLTAAFNDARDICERWAATGLPWPEPGPRVVRLYDPASDESSPTTMTSRRRRRARADARGGARRAAGRAATRRQRPADRRRRRLARAPRDAPPTRRARSRSSSRTAAHRRCATLELAAYGCPVCGLCAGPAVEHPRRRPCPDCLAALRRLEREPGSVERC